jgi:hypothetical protein
VAHVQIFCEPEFKNLEFLKFNLEFYCAVNRRFYVRHVRSMLVPFMHGSARCFSSRVMFTVTVSTLCNISDAISAII